MANSTSTKGLRCRISKSNVFVAFNENGELKVQCVKCHRPFGEYKECPLEDE